MALTRKELATLAPEKYVQAPRQEELRELCTNEEEIETLLEFLVKDRGMRVSNISPCIKRKSGSVQPRHSALLYCRQQATQPLEATA